MVDLGSGSQRNLEDYHLSRFACYKGRYGRLGREGIKRIAALPSKNSNRPRCIAPSTGPIRRITSTDFHGPCQYVNIDIYSNP